MPREIFAHLNTKSWTALCAVVWLGFLATSATAQSPLLPQKQTPRPETTNGVPHVQIGITPDPKLSQALLKVVAEFPGVQLGPTRVSLPGAVGFQLLDEVSLAQPEAIVGGPGIRPSASRWQLARIARSPGCPAGNFPRLGCCPSVGHKAKRLGGLRHDLHPEQPNGTEDRHSTG